jgi:hypothetical protein
MTIVINNGIGAFQIMHQAEQSEKGSVDINKMP